MDHVTRRKRLGATYLALAATTLALAVAGTANAQVIDQGVAEGNSPGIHLEAFDTTTAFNLGAWSFSPVVIIVDYNVDCANPANDTFGRVSLVTGLNATVWVGNRSVGQPWLGWDVCKIDAFYNTEFGLNDDGSLPSSAIAGWITSHNGY